MVIQEESILSGKIIGCALKVHRHLGPGLLESIYEECLCFEMSKASIKYERQKSIPINYKGVLLGNDLKLDLLVNNEIVVELKSTKKIEPIHEAQLLTYLKLTNHKYGLLINFNVRLLKDGIKRIAN